MSGIAPIQTFPKKDPAGSPFTPGSARNGASVDSTGAIVLGNDVGEPGAPGQLLTNREILMDLAGSIFFSNSGVPEFSEIRPGILGVFSNVDISETSLSPGRIQVTSFPTQDAIIFMGGNQANEMQINWQNVANLMRLGDDTNDLWLTFFGGAASGNVVIGPGTLIDNGSRLQVDGFISCRHVTDTLDFPNTAAQTSSDIPVAVVGAVLGDTVNVAPVSGVVPADGFYYAFVSNPDEVTVRFCNFSAAAIDPAQDSFNITLFKPM